MPLKLVPPRLGKSPNWTIRGTYLGHRVDQTSGTPDRKVAMRKLAQIRADIERGTFSPPSAPTFADAALRYIEMNGEDRFVMRLADHFGNTPLSRIDQAAVDEAALALYPRATDATRNRQVYTPVSAILRRAGIKQGFDRPKGARGKSREFHFSTDQASRLLAAAGDIDLEFGQFLAFMLYSGCRLSEACKLQIRDLDLSQATIQARDTKNGTDRPVHLPPVLVSLLANHPRGLDRAGKLFRFSKNGRLYEWLDRAATAAGVVIPPRVAFHAFRHTYGAWMRRHGGLDTSGLVATGAWRSRQAAELYEHANPSEEAQKANHLPNVWNFRGTNKKEA